MCILNCKISHYDIYHSDTRCTLLMSMYVDSLMMAEMVAETCRSVKINLLCSGW